MNTTPRRTFLKAAGAATLPSWISRASANQASNRVAVALIGPGGMGSNHLRLLAARDDVEVAWVCDPDANRKAEAARTVLDLAGRAPQESSDLRRALEDPRVDAVFIATPDHWHAPAAILACDAGKHVYVEKPASHNFREGQLLVEAARRTGRIIQTGTQSRSSEPMREVIQRIREGAIGEVVTARVWNSQRRSQIGRAQPEAPPDYLDFDLWLGPAPAVPYRPNLLPSIWRWWRDFGCGDIGNDGVHDLDIARWGLGTAHHPLRIAALGGKYMFDDDMQWPDTQTAIFEFDPADGAGHPRQILFEQRIWSPYFQENAENGVVFHGSQGSLWLAKNAGWKLYGERNALIEERQCQPDLAAHHQNFLDALRGEAVPNCDAAEGHASAALCHFANIATRLQRTLHFEPASETISGDEEAAALLRRSYRDHWARPAGA
ncbi:MAG TPA: Gfo/Idh/MocA family oxidoreductase [Verrucomicrobiales bacterium]|nr:Gfo/Idh/MocA family oxidoreductase [Verrucomicrobiales bacterium]